MSGTKKKFMSEIILENDRKLVIETNDSKIESRALDIDREEKSLALRALRALAYRCDRNQSASRKCGLIQTVSTFLYDKGGIFEDKLWMLWMSWHVNSI